MPNLTSYHAPAIHLNRELPKTYCNLIEHEFKYIHFLRTRVANIQSSLASTNKKHCIKTVVSQHQYFDDHQLPHIYEKSFVDCCKENDKNHIKISHFYLRQKRWKEKIENENKRFIHSLIYHQEKYRPINDRYTAQKSFEQHLKLLEMMSQYSKYSLNNPICKTFQNNIKFNQSNKYREIKPNQYSRRSTSYIDNIVQQTINKAIRIYNQPLPSPSSRIRKSYSEINERLKPSLYHQQKIYRSIYGVNSLDLGLKQTD